MADSFVPGKLFRTPAFIKTEGLPGLDQSEDGRNGTPPSRKWKDAFSKVRVPRTPEKRLTRRLSFAEFSKHMMQTVGKAYNQEMDGLSDLFSQSRLYEFRPSYEINPNNRKLQDAANMIDAANKMVASAVQKHEPQLERFLGDDEESSSDEESDFFQNQNQNRARRSSIAYQGFQDTRDFEAVVMEGGMGMEVNRVNKMFELDDDDQEGEEDFFEDIFKEESDLDEPSGDDQIAPTEMDEQEHTEAKGWGVGELKANLEAGRNSKHVAHSIEVQEGIATTESVSNPPRRSGKLTGKSERTSAATMMEQRREKLLQKQMKASEPPKTSAILDALRGPKSLSTKKPMNLTPKRTPKTKLHVDISEKVKMKLHLDSDPTPKRKPDVIAETSLPEISHPQPQPLKEATASERDVSQPKKGSEKDPTTPNPTPEADSVMDLVTVSEQGDKRNDQIENKPEEPKEPGEPAYGKSLPMDNHEEHLETHVMSSPDSEPIKERHSNTSPLAEPPSTEDRISPYEPCEPSPATQKPTAESVQETDGATQPDVNKEIEGPAIHNDEQTQTAPSNTVKYVPDPIVVRKTKHVARASKLNEQADDRAKRVREKLERTEERLQQRRQGNRATFVPNPTMLFEQTYSEVIGQEGHIMFGLGHLEGCVRRLGSLAVSKAAYYVYLIRSSWYPYCLGSYQASTNIVSFVCIHGPNVHDLWEFRFDEVSSSVHPTMPHNVVLCHKKDPSRSAVHLESTWSRVCSYIEQVQQTRTDKFSPLIASLDEANESKNEKNPVPSGWGQRDIFWPSMEMAVPLMHESTGSESGEDTGPLHMGVLDRVISWQEEFNSGVEVPNIEWARALAANKGLSALSNEQMDHAFQVPGLPEGGENADRKSAMTTIRQSLIAKKAKGDAEIEKDQFLDLGVKGSGEFVALMQEEGDRIVPPLKRLEFDQASTPASSDPYHAFVPPELLFMLQEAEGEQKSGTWANSPVNLNPQPVSEVPRPQEPQPVSEVPRPQEPQPVSEVPRPQEPLPVSEVPPPQQDLSLHVRGEDTIADGLGPKGGWTPPSSRDSLLLESVASQVMTFSATAEHTRSPDSLGGWTAIDKALRREPNPLEKPRHAPTGSKTARRDDKNKMKVATDAIRQTRQGFVQTVQPLVVSRMQSAQDANHPPLPKGKPPLSRPKPAEPPPESSALLQPREIGPAGARATSDPEETDVVVPALKPLKPTTSVLNGAVAGAQTARGRLEGDKEELASKAKRPKAWKFSNRILDRDSQTRAGEFAVRTASIGDVPCSPMSLYNHPSMTPRPAHATVGEKHAEGRQLRILLSRNSDPSAQGDNKPGNFQVDGPLHLGRVEFDTVHPSGKALRSCGGRKLRNGVTVGWEVGRSGLGTESGIALPAMPRRRSEKALPVEYGFGEDGGQRRSSGQLLPKKEKRGGLLPWITRYDGSSAGGKQARKTHTARDQDNYDVIRPSMILL